MTSTSRRGLTAHRLLITPKSTHVPVHQVVGPTILTKINVSFIFNKNLYFICKPIYEYSFGLQGLECSEIYIFSNKHYLLNKVVLKNLRYQTSSIILRVIPKWFMKI